MNVIIMNRATLQKYLYGNFPYQNTAVISFYGENEQSVNFSVNPNVKFVKVNIDDCRWVEEPEKWEANKFASIARSITGWKALGNIENIICQCESGISRSAGCAAAIREFYHHDGIKIFAMTNYYPNTIVFNGVYKRLTQEWKDKYIGA